MLENSSERSTFTTFLNSNEMIGIKGFVHREIIENILIKMRFIMIRKRTQREPRIVCKSFMDRNNSSIITNLLQRIGTSG